MDGNEVYFLTSDREPLYIHNRFVIHKSLYRIIDEIKFNVVFHHGISSPSLITCLRYKSKNVILNCDNHADFNNSLNHYISKFYHLLIWKIF